MKNSFLFSPLLCSNTWCKHTVISGSGADKLLGREIGLCQQGWRCNHEIRSRGSKGLAAPLSSRVFFLNLPEHYKTLAIVRQITP